MRRAPFIFLTLSFAAVLLFPGCMGTKSGAGAPAPLEAPKIPAAAQPPAAVQPKKEPLRMIEERCKKSACFKKTETYRGLDFHLQGMSLRKHLWIDVYTAAFYLPDPKVKRVYGIPQGAKMLILEYHRSIEKKKIVESIESKVSTLPYAGQETLREHFRQLTDAFVPPHKGFRYQFVYLPERGTSLIYEGRERVLIPGEDFANAFFGIWLYEKETSPIRRELLGVEAGSKN